MPVPKVTEAESTKAGRPSASLYLPVRVIYADDQAELRQEVTKTNYISAKRALIPLRQQLPAGQVVRLALPLPLRWRQHSLSEHLYVTAAEVLATQSVADHYLTSFKFLSTSEVESRAVAREAQSACSATEPAPRAERRGATRLAIPLGVTLQLLDRDGRVLAQEETVTENISAGGARLLTTFEAAVGSLVRVTTCDGFSSRATVKRSYQGSDKVRRLNVQFTDKDWRL